MNEKIKELEAVLAACPPGDNQQRAPVKSNEAMTKGTAFIPIHFGGNALAPFACNYKLKTPVLRGIPIEIEKI
ncbi:MAG: hypothetical protein QME74_11620 [Candidatus Edwardsbacteria bacterium]|nr:hypothetical protein [Candidatus Edwardsbacteria bacterium]